MQPPTRSKKSVLIVDDEEDLRASVTMALEERGYDVLSDGDGLVGRPAASEHRPILILVDYRMPELDGVEFLYALRSTEGLTDPHEVIISVDPEIELRRNAEQLSIQGFFVK